MEKEIEEAVYTWLLSHFPDAEVDHRAVGKSMGDGGKDVLAFHVRIDGATTLARLELTQDALCDSSRPPLDLTAKLESSGIIEKWHDDPDARFRVYANDAVIRISTTERAD